MSFEKQERQKVVVIVSGWRKILPIVRIPGSQVTKLRIRWRLATVWFAALFVVGYFALSAAAFSYVRSKQGLEELSFWDVALPNRWDNYRRRRAEAHIVQGKSAASRGDLRGALQFLRVGLSQVPEDNDARRLLAEIFRVANRADLAEKTLIEGMPFNRANFEYVRETFKFLMFRQADELVVKLANDLRAPGSGASELTRRTATLAAATSDFHQGRFNSAEALLAELGPIGPIEAELLKAKIDWARGYRDLSLLKLRSLAQANPNEPAVYSALLQYLRDAGQMDEARRLALERLIKYPDDPRAKIDALHGWQAAGDTEMVQQAADEILRRFGDNLEALIALGDFAASTGQVEITENIYERAKSEKLPLDTFEMMWVEAIIEQRNYQDALAKLDALFAENKTRDERLRAVLNGLRAIAATGAGDKNAARLYLQDYLQDARTRAENLVAVSNRLTGLKAYDAARLVLSQAVGAEPRNQLALMALVRLDLETGNVDQMPEHVSAMLALRKAPNELLRQIRQRLGSDEFIFNSGRNILIKRIDSMVNNG